MSERLLPDTWRRPVLGLLGGMGPAATVTFLDALSRATAARTDQDHIDTVVLSHSTTPDRTAYLRDDTSASPRPYLLGDLELLARLGADAAVIACNTAHAFLPQELPLPLISLIEVGADAAVAQAGERVDRPTITVLATDGTLLSGLYQEALERRRAAVHLPDAEAQQRVMSMIYDGVKAGVEVPTNEFLDLVAELSTGSDAVLLGCTELSVLADQAGVDLPARVVDAQAALVARVVADFSRRG